MNKFAFIVHPRSINDINSRLENIFGSKSKYLTKIIPKYLIDLFFKHLKGRFGFTVCSHFNIFGKIDGYIIAVLLTAEQMKKMPKKFVQKRIVDAILFAQNKLGVNRIGLGAYTTPLTKGGLLLVEDRRIKCAITHGGSLTSISVIQVIKKVAIIKNKKIKNSTIAIVGAYGIVGRAVSILVSKLNPKKIILTGPKKYKLIELRNEINKKYNFNEILISTDNNIIKEADISVLCSTAKDSIITANIIKKNSIIIDVAQPNNMSKKVSEKRKDVLRVDGGYMSIPNIDLHFNIGTPKEVAFACFVETLILTLINDKKNYIGPINIKFSKYIFKEAQKFGFKLSPLTNFSKPI